MSKELDLFNGGALTLVTGDNLEGPGASSGKYFEGNLHGLTVRVVLANGTHVNGYVKLPEGHPWANRDLFENDWDLPADVHGGITYRHDEWIGFDTAHGADFWPQFGNPLNDWKRNVYGDTLHVWTPEELLAEVAGLALQAVKAGKELTDGGHSHIFGSATEADVIDGMES